MGGESEWSVALADDLRGARPAVAVLVVAVLAVEPAGLVLAVLAAELANLVLAELAVKVAGLVLAGLVLAVLAAELAGLVLAGLVLAVEVVALMLAGLVLARRADAAQAGRGHGSRGRARAGLARAVAMPTLRAVGLLRAAGQRVRAVAGPVEMAPDPPAVGRPQQDVRHPAVEQDEAVGQRVPAVRVRVSVGGAMQVVLLRERRRADPSSPVRRVVGQVAVPGAAIWRRGTAREVPRRPAEARWPADSRGARAPADPTMPSGQAGGERLPGRKTARDDDKTGQARQAAPGTASLQQAEMRTPRGGLQGRGQRTGSGLRDRSADLGRRVPASRAGHAGRARMRQVRRRRTDTGVNAGPAAVGPAAVKNGRPELPVIRGEAPACLVIGTAGRGARMTGTVGRATGAVGRGARVTGTAGRGVRVTGTAGRGVRVTGTAGRGVRVTGTAGRGARVTGTVGRGARATKAAGCGAGRSGSLCPQASRRTSWILPPALSSGRFPVILLTR